ncbi:MAG: hypothetical protein IJU95_01920 [Treponema sp.]|nr:hypothetical protein [Treponema sp.]
MDQKRPRGRDTHVTNNSAGVHKRGEGLGTGPVGSSSGYGKPGASSSSGSSSGGVRAIGGGGIGLVIIVLLVKMFLGGGLSSGGNSGTSSSQQETQAESSSSSSILDGLSGILGGSASSGSLSSSSSSGSATSYSRLDTSVASGSRAKYTKLVGGGNDTVTIMVYMCGTDLESKHGMASSDLGEMAAADIGDKVNLLVYTGGCKNWKTQGISNSDNQIYQVVSGGLKPLVKSDGNKVMTDPNTLSSYIKWCKSKYPADRYELIFWDHGGGSVSGYGYDEKNPRKGSMSLSGINKALKDGGVKFDFIGFDACLMATAETALMLNSYGDYMISSEETEPGIGWFYTNWLNQLGANTSTSTLEIGKTIVDDFVSKCNQKCPGQKTTLSIIDLAEFSNTVPSKLTSFSKSLTNLIAKDNYKTVSDARYNTREFASSSRIDQIDLVDLCNKTGNNEGKALAKVLQGAVKYNKTSSNMTNAYGVSIYFPYKNASYVDTACDNYEDIGMDDSYADCIKAFASMEVCGQAASGGSSAASPVGSLFDLLGSSSSSGEDAIGSILGSFLGGGSGGGSALGSIIGGLASSNFLSGRAMSTDETAGYISANYFDDSALRWSKTANGKYQMHLDEEQWSLVHALDMNMFYDDGEGYIDLGLDNVYDWTDSGDLLARTDKTWIAINGQPVAYYHMDTTEDGDAYTITGRVPALLNGDRVNLWIVFDNEHPYGYIAGAAMDYNSKTSDVVAKSMTELQVGDKLDFLCDYYGYSGDYKDSYKLGERMTVSSKMEISNVNVGSDNVRLMYRFTDIYNQPHWSEYIQIR